MSVVPFKRVAKALTAKAGLAHLAKVASTRPDNVVEAESITALGVLLGWKQSRISKQLKAWKTSGKVTVDTAYNGKLLVKVMPFKEGLRSGASKGTGMPKVRRTRRRSTGAEPHAESHTVEGAEPHAEGHATSHAKKNGSDHASRPNGTESSTAYPNQVEGKAASVKASSAAPEASRNTSTQATGNTSTPEASATVTEAPEATVVDAPKKHAGTAVERATERPVWRRRGGGVTTSGGGGFDAVETFSRASMAERILLLIAAGLSTTAAYMSVTGMVVMYPFEPVVIMVFGGLIEAAKFFGFGVLAAGWRWYGGFSRLVAALLLLVAAVINASGVYGRLIADHVGPAADRTAAFTTRDAGEGAKIEASQGRLSDLDRRISQIDDAIAAATKRGRTNGAMVLAEREKRNRAQLAGERDKANQELANLKAGRTGMAARHQGDEASSTPVKYAAALFEDFGLLKPGTDPEKLMRWISFLILLTGDPLALALMWTVNSRGRA